MTTKEQEILDKISELKAALIEGRPDPKSTKEAPKPDLPSLLKHHLINVDQKVTTQDFITKHFAEALGQLKQAHEEVVKTPWQEIMELLGFDKLYKGFEEILKGGFAAAVPALLLGLTQVLLPLIAIVVGAAALAGSRWLMTKLLNGDVITMNGPRGPFARENAQVVQQREARIANGGTSLADLVSDPANADRARRLREQLVPLNKAVDRFDRLAPTFLESFAKLPGERKATKAATAVGKISDAVNAVNRVALKEVVEGYEKLNKAIDDHQPTKIPKETELAGVARKMNDLATETQTLRDKFNGLRGTIRTLDDVIAGAAG
ncbi:hypothetical protein [Streptomyces filamentosus]|uniref:hypothetical protein n=1 Tax=Streptomyces filamentosus TaxID=67294 RepID=UPI0033C92AE9